jgi:hypothetical protein
MRDQFKLGESRYPTCIAVKFTGEHLTYLKALLVRVFVGDP